MMLSLIIGRQAGCRRSARGLLAVLALAVSMFAVFGATKPTLAGSVEAQPAFDRPVVATGSQDLNVYLRVRFDVAPAPETLSEDRPPINLSLVLDRSGSMDASGKIAYLRDAAVLAVHGLAAKDRIAVVEYDDRITVMWRSQPASELGALIGRIMALTPRGSTNLAGGLEAGIDEARRHVGDETVSRVILMTDGLANEGITEPRLIRQIALDAKRAGVRASTIGLGLDFNETLLQGIAEAGGGTYHFVDDPKAMARIFEEELRMLATTVAKDGVLRIEDVPADVQVEALGLPSETKGSTTHVALEDFFADEERTLMLRFSIKDTGSDTGDFALGRLVLAYQDTLTDQPVLSEQPLSVRVSADPALVDQAMDKGVAAEAALADADLQHAKAMDRFEAGEAAEAQAVMQGLIGTLKTRNEALNDDALSAKIEALEVDVDRAQAAPSSAGARQMMKAARQQVYQNRRGKGGLLMLQEGDQGPQVARIVDLLTQEGFYSGPQTDTFTPELEQSLRAYQAQQGLTADGIAGPKTLNRMGMY